MRIWHRRAMAWIGSSSSATMRMPAISRGVTENCSAATSRTVNVKLLTLIRSCAGHLAARLDLLEEVVDEFADFVATVKPPPQHSQPAHELVAGVDGDEIALGGRVEVRIGMVAIGYTYQQCLDIVG